MPATRESRLTGRAPVWLAILFLVLGPHAQAQLSGARVTVEQLQNRIQAVPDAADLSDSDKARLTDLYRQAINNLETARANEATAAEFREAKDTAPRETGKIRAGIESRRNTDPLAGLGITAATPVTTISRKLDEELANQTAVEAKLAVLEARLESEAARPAEARARITAVRAQLAQLAGPTDEPFAGYQPAQLVEAQRWARDTRLYALQTEIAMLDRELLSYDARRELLEAQREQQLQGLQRINARIEALGALSIERRRMEADRAIAQAQAALETAQVDRPLVRELADDNLRLVSRLQSQLEEIDRLVQVTSALPTPAQIEAAFRSARRKLEFQATGIPVGQSVLDERAGFPGAREYEAQRRMVGRLVTAASARLIAAEDEREALADLDAYLDRRLAEQGLAELDAGDRRQLKELARTRRSLLDRAIANDTALQRRWYNVGDVLNTLAERTRAYDAFLKERLLWVRSTERIDAKQWARLPAELGTYLAPGPWLETIGLIGIRALQAPIYLLIVLLAAFLALRAGHFRRCLADSGRNVGRIREDSMALTFRAIGYSILLAAPVPLLLAGIGVALATAPQASAFAAAIGDALLDVAVWLAVPLLLLKLLRGDGLAGRHFGWDQETLKDSRRQLRFFITTGFPIYFVIETSRTTGEMTGSFGGTLTLVAFLALMATLVILAVGLGHPTRGAERRWLAAHRESRWWRWRYLWFPAAVLAPVALAVLSYFGYDYTTQQLGERLFESVWIVTAIWLGAALVRRWLLMTNRRLAYNNALAALEAARARRAGAEEGQEQAGDDDIGEPEIDLAALDTDSRQLLNATVLLLVILALIGVWGDIVPAFGVFERVSLWNKTALMDGIEQLVPVTLKDLLLVVVVAIGGYVLAANLPSLLNIILLKQGSVSASGRYTIQTLTSYTIIAATVLLVLSLLGVRAAQLGWAAAALGVGIGFGLQEIVANFICGLILLFERPIRVGDVITVGDASGTVTRIRIRATTIRDWDRRELVLPNKELITGRLLNWTLSDAVTRITINVGVAYGSDTDRAMALMLEAADESPMVLKDPEPFANFEQFADSSLSLTLRIFIGATADRLTAQTDVHTRIDRKFREAGIVIAFPQRDVHIFPGDSGLAAPG